MINEPAPTIDTTAATDYPVDDTAAAATATATSLEHVAPDY